MNDTLSTALTLAAKDVHVFPLRPGTKDGQYLKSWAHEATIDAVTIWRWFTFWDKANLAIHLGKSGLIVIDLDRHPGAPDGLATWIDLRLKHASGPDDVGGLRTQTARVFTPSGGEHWYYRLPAGCDVGNMRSTLGPGIDVKRGTAYVLCPPSSIDGRRYEWEPRGRIAMLPNLLQELLQKPTYTPRASTSTPIRCTSNYVTYVLQTELTTVARAANGTRNKTLYMAAYNLGKLIASPWAELDEAMVRRELLSAAVSIGLRETASDDTITSGFEFGATRPRPAPAGGAR